MVTVRQVCDKCRDPFLLLVCTTKGWLCSDCWRRLGKPGPPSMSMAAVHEAEVATRERMNKRGGAFRHLVQKGLT